mmetsp:Transcript_42282/g.48814  ORF Transcript_42282/g.48814 Transcript_42282/m.48814 type:complete len:519 (-) Transcript_42282:97-1653(-)
MKYYQHPIHVGSYKNNYLVVAAVMIIANLSARPRAVVTSAFFLGLKPKNEILNNLVKMKTIITRSSGGYNSNNFVSMTHYSSVSVPTLSFCLGVATARLDIAFDNTMGNNHSTISTDNSTVITIQQQEEDEEEEKIFLHPDDFGSIPFPKHLSPSSAMAFKECPQSFLFQYLYNIKQPTNHVLAKGSMCHSALEHIFDLDPKDRTIDNLHNMLRVSWAEHRLEDEYRFLFERERERAHEITNENNEDHTNSSTTSGGVERDIEAEIEWGRSALQLLDNYYRSEDPRTIHRPNPHKREVWVNANLTIDPNMGVTAAATACTNNNSITNTNSINTHTIPGSGQPGAFKVRGIIDRIDMVRESSRKVTLKIIDYKTGKAPNLKYSPTMNQHIFQKNFYQLKIYALLLREKNSAAVAKTNNGSSSKNKNDGNNSDMELRYLKLHYLNSINGRAKPWEMDLGETQDIRDEALNEVHRDLSQIWVDILSCVEKQDPKAFVHCDRSFCFCHKCRERFVPGTVWER